MVDLKKYSGSGMETTEGISSTMPFIQIIQSGSPEIKRSHEQHEVRKIEGAQEGDLVFLPEKILFKGSEGVKAIPLAFKVLYTEWRPKTEGGGFIGTQTMSVVSEQRYRKEGYKEFLGSNELIATIYVGILFQDGEEWKEGIISFTSTQLKKARNWSKIIASFRYPQNRSIAPPIFACSFRVCTKSESNDSGDWFGYEIKTEGPIEDEALLDKANEAVASAKRALPSPEERKSLPPQKTSEAVIDDEEMPF